MQEDLGGGERRVSSPTNCVPLPAIVQGSGLEVLVSGLQSLKEQLAEHTGQLKALVGLLLRLLPLFHHCCCFCCKLHRYDTAQVMWPCCSVPLPQVKENFDRFISSKDTIDDIHSKLQSAEAGASGGAHGASTTQVAAAVAGVQAEARHAFGALLERQAKAERIKLVLGAIQQYEAVVRLPARVREHVEAGDHEQASCRGWRQHRRSMPLAGQLA